MNSRRNLLLLVLAGLLAVTAIWSYQTMADSRLAALRAQDDLAQCSRMADRIEALRRRPALAAQAQRGSAETIGLIESAAKDADIPGSRILQIMPEQPRRLGDTVYMEKPTRIRLKNVTLEQLTKLTHAIRTDKNRLHDKAMDLSPPSSEDTGRLWNVDLVLTYLIYNPPKIR